MNENNSITLLERITKIVNIAITGALVELIFLFCCSFVSQSAAKINPELVFATSSCFSLVILIAIIFVIVKTKIKQELKAALAIIPFQTLFLLIMLGLAILVKPLEHIVSDNAITTIWIILICLSIAVFFYYLVIKQKSWLYIASAIISLIPLVYIFVFASGM